MQLYEFQETGVDFLLSPLPGTENYSHVLGDEMGLGKTVQTCAALRRITRSTPEKATALIFCPASDVVKNSWKAALIEWGGFFESEIFIIKTGKDIIPGGARAIIMGYELVTVPEIKKQLFSRWYTAVICDECQRLKSLKSKRTKVILGSNNGKGPLVGRGWYRWYLSATWMPNRPAELYPIIKVNAPAVIEPHTDWDEFGKYFCDGYLEDFGGWNFSGASHVSEFRGRLTKSGFYLGRKVDDVHDQLPPVVIENVYLDVGYIEEDVSTHPMPTVRKAVGLAKLPFAIQYIEEWLIDHPNDKLLVFTYTVDVIEALYDYFKKWGAAAIYGKSTKAYRDAAFQSFTKGETRIYFMQVDSGGEGTDGLQLACNNAVAVELQWSDGKEDQLIGRLRRIKQTKVTKYTRLIAEGTLDNPIHGVLKKKRKISDELFGTKKENETMPIEQTLEQIRVAVEKGNELLASVQSLLQNQQTTTVNLGKSDSDTTSNAKNAVEPSSTASPASQDTKPEAKKPGRPAKEQKPAPVADTTTVSASLEDLQKACQKHLKDSGKTEADARKDIITVFQKFGAQNIKELPKEDYAEAIEQIGKLVVTSDTAGDDGMFG